MKLELTLLGTTPLMMHNVRLASTLDPYARKLKTLNGKRNKTDEDRMEIARVEWEGGLYYDEEIGPYLPAVNVFRSLIEGARLTKSGKKVERGVMMIDTMLPLSYDGPRDTARLWGDGPGSPFVDVRTVTIMRAKVDRCRPIFPKWSAKSTWLIDTSIIEREEFEAIAATAGQMIGIGDYRLLYGRSDAKVTQID